MWQNILNEYDKLKCPLRNGSSKKNFPLLKEGHKIKASMLNTCMKQPFYFLKLYYNTEGKTSAFINGETRTTEPQKTLNVKRHSFQGSSPLAI